MDQADLVLQWLPQIARDSGVPKEHWEEINTTANDLRTLFEKVHQNIDDQKHPDFASVAQDDRPENRPAGRDRSIATRWQAKKANSSAAVPGRVSGDHVRFGI